MTLLLRRVLPLLAVTALLAASLMLAEDAAGGAVGLAARYRWVLGAALLALVVLAVAIGQRLWRLRADVRRGVPGARLRRRLLRLLLLLALPSSVLVHGFALRFMDATVDTWFNVSMEEALEDALEIGRIAVADRLQRAEDGTLQLAARLAAGADADQALDAALDALDATQLALLDGAGRVLASTSSDPAFLEPPVPDGALLLRLARDGRYAQAEPFGEVLALRVVVPVGDAGFGRTLLQGLFPLPPRLATLTRGVEQASLDFQRLKFLRASLKLTFALILSFVLLLSLLVVVLAAFGLARRLVAPIGRLDAATRALAAGRYDAPLPEGSDDELGSLVRSFAHMTRELERADSRARHGAREIERQRAWLEALLARLSAGVLGLDREGVLRVANPAADAILGTPLGAWLGRDLAALRHQHPHLAGLLDPLARNLRDGVQEWREEMVLGSGEGARVLMLRGAALPEQAGFVAVFDDLTVLDRAQRDAAWGEVARRLAHEVRNPLTPIQLAAERLRRRFLGRLPDDEGELLDRATRTIVSQVEALKTMVNAFADFARAPPAALVPIALNALVAEVLDLYENDQRLALVRDLAEGEPRVRGDPVRLRQALHNLVKNALEAAGSGRATLRVATRATADAGGSWVELEVADNGPGLPPDFDERWFEPYTSSKPRGTGLGLAVVKKIIEEHGGRISAANLPAGGATFVLRLPLWQGS